MPSLSTKERNTKFSTNDLIFRKKFNFILEHYYLLNTTAESLTNKYKLFESKSKQQLIFQIHQKTFFFNTLKEIYND